jgi:hypothetical protein
MMYLMEGKRQRPFFGVYSALPLFVQAYCTLARRNFLPSSLEALCISQTHSALCWQRKELMEFGQQFRNFRRELGSFT